MAKPAPVTPVKLFVVTLHREVEALNAVRSELEQEWGECDFQSADFPFDQTDYYEKEMGSNLFRRFLSFQRLITPDRIVEAKLFTNLMEEKYSGESGRRINLDPGYLDYYKLVLASAKFGGQKVYLRSGIYADMTLVVFRGKWEAFQWSFPDFKSGLYDQTLFQIRDLYKSQVKLLS